MTEKYQDKRQTTAQMLVDSLNLNPACYWCQVEWNNFWVYGNIIPLLMMRLDWQDYIEKAIKKEKKKQQRQN